MTHSVFSIVAPVAPANVECLKKYLDPDGIGRETPIPGLCFDDLDVHFASFVVFPPPDVATPPGVPARVAGTLVFENCVDGPIDMYLDALMRVGAKKLLAIFSHCVDFKPDGADEMAYLRDYLGTHVRRPHLHHIGNPRASTAQIAAGASLRSALDSELDKAVSRRRSLDQPQLIIERLRETFHLPPSAHDHWHLDPESPALDPKLPAPRVYAWFSDPAFAWPSRLWHWSRALALALGSLALALWVLWAISAWAGARGLLIAPGVAVLAAWIVWRWLTGGQQKPATLSLDPKHLRELTEREDRGVRNHMASLALLKPGFLRRFVLRGVFFSNNLFYRTVFTDLTPGRLFGLPTIHFAQWTILPVFDSEGNSTEREALLFLSNYDSSWETYLDDFLAYLIYGVIAFWANTDGFPRPLDGRIFKQWARTRMTPWQHWHQHRCYGDLTVLNILNNDSIRKGLLRGPETDHAARLWLARFGAIKEGNESFEETHQLEEAEIQGLVLTGFRHLEDAQYVFLRIAENGTLAARRWLGERLLPRITDARERPGQERAADTSAVNLAVTWRGLRALGLDDSVLNRFPLAFKEGVAPGKLEGVLPEKLEHRSRILGDTGDSAPEWWKWGGSENRVDLLVMIFGKKEKVARHANWLIKTFEDSGAGSLVASQDAQFLNGPGVDPKATFEHFGFRDGLSDPIIEGSWRARRYDTSVHLMKPGEFLLGYPAADGTVALGICVETRLDPQSLLPPIPRSAVALGDVRGHDFGRNGTYLVCRQLAQDVAGFRRFVGRAAGSTHRDSGAEAVGARIVGRWRDGTPIGVDPRDPTHPTNEFGFASDPHGFGCPIGAHVRRANPRDSLGADPIAGLRSANRHRLLRRGRPYGPPLPEYRRENDGEERGLLFICLNSDIERQFEFVQQNWINNPAFGGLYCETDPLVGGHGDASYLTVQANAVRHRFTGFSQFVKVRGGEYFFLPSLSALRFLATLATDDASSHASGPNAVVDLLFKPVPAPVPRNPTRLHAALAVLDMILPWLRIAWAVRVPLLLIAALLLLPFTPRLSPGIATTLFLVDGWRGIFVVALVASLAAFVSMVTLRIVLLYGERLGLGRPRWRGPARWTQVLAFQALAVPAVLACIQQTALDLAATGVHATFWSLAGKLLPAGFAGFVAATLCMLIATSIQAFKRGSRPDLFFPPNPLSRRAALRGVRWSRPRWIARLVSAVTRWVVDAVPAGMGEGYIDYRRRRVLPGHVFAIALASVVFLLYTAGYFILRPGYGVTGLLPPITYLFFVLIGACWLLSALTFFFDRYHIPTLAVLVVWLAAVASLARTDHYFEVKGSLAPALSPHDAMERADERNRNAHVIVVAAEGMGLASSAWTAEVLTRLREELGPEFTQSLRMISAASGAALGSMHFVNEYTKTGFGHDEGDEASRRLPVIRARAQTPSSAEGAWGLAYPDLVRLFAPIVPRLLDRDWARETAWRRALEGGAEPRLSAWRRDVAAGWRPATAFGVTVVESGERGLLATYEPPRKKDETVPDVTGGHDVSLLTAARLSSAFPFISPAARPDNNDRAAYHVVDGGYWDNSGIVSAIEWLDAAQPIRPERVVLIEIRSSPIRSSPHAARQEPENPSWLFGLTAPLRTLVNVRYQGQPYRNRSALRQYRDLWDALHHRPLLHVVFELNDERMPLTWNLGKAAPIQLEAAWRQQKNRDQLALLRDHLNRR